MKRLSSRWIPVSLVVAIAIWLAGYASAQDFPNRPIHLVVPFPPGGPADIVARPLAEGLGVELGQPVVIINKPGASGTIGATFVARSEPDGYTLLMGTSNELTMSPGLFDQLPYDPSRDFAPITTTVVFPNVLVVNKDLPIHSARELVEATRANPEHFAYGTSGTGSTNHLTAELYRASTKLTLHYVPYRGGAAAMTDLMGGRIQAMFATMPSCSALVNAGSLRALMVTDTRRWAAIPGVPDAREAGLPEVKVISFNGVLAPAGTPGPILEHLHDSIVRVMNTPAMKEQMAATAGEVATSTPAGFAETLRVDFSGWLNVIKANGIHAD